MKNRILIPTLAVLALVMAGLFLCTNNPWDKSLAEPPAFFTSYGSLVRNLDPSTSFYTHESYILDNIVEAPLSYHYLKRPYELIPQLLTEIPRPEYQDARGNALEGEPPPQEVARAIYTLHLRPGILYEPHECFGGKARSVTAEDLKVAIARLCDARISSPVYSNFRSFLPGMEECSRAIRAEVERLDAERLSAGESESALLRYPSLPDYRHVPIPGVEAKDALTLEITLSRKYPQFLYWLAMHFFAPIPWEALEHYARKEAIDKGMTYGSHPVGTGAYMLEIYEPNNQIVLTANPNYHEAFYPSEGEQGDGERGLLDDAGKRLPLTRRIVYKYEKESIPTWIKFLQGYYDASGDNGSIPTDMMDVAVDFNPVTGGLELSEEMRARQLNIFSNVMMISYYFAFNGLDPVVGGNSPEKRALRQAIAIVCDMDEYVNIFRNGCGIPAEGILPPGIFGHVPPPEDINSHIHAWNSEQVRSVPLPLEHARALMETAGYPNGIGADGRQLVLYLDHAAAGNPGFKTRFIWLSEKLAKLGIRLEERQADLNRHREKIEKGNWQMQFERGWVADYPDPENFLMLFYSKNGIVKSGGKGSNNFNYESAEFDAVFERLETMMNTPERQELIRQANQILYRDCPVCWGYFPVNTILTHHWLHNYKPNFISRDNMKYLRIDAEARRQYQEQRNRPNILPVMLPLLLAMAAVAYAIFRKD